jgi:hypothetical protein
VPEASGFVSAVVCREHVVWSCQKGDIDVHTRARLPTSSNTLHTADANPLVTRTLAHSRCEPTGDAHTCTQPMRTHWRGAHLHTAGADPLVRRTLAHGQQVKWRHMTTSIE